MTSDANSTFQYHNFTGNLSSENYSSWNMEGGGIYADVLELGVILTQLMTLPLSCVAILFNCLVFGATRKASSAMLKSKTFILNAVVGDIAFAVGVVVPASTYFFDVFRMVAAREIALAVSNFVGTATQFGQLFASALLALDRIYAMIKPLMYHTTGYSTLAKVLLVGSSWIATILLLLPPLINPSNGGRFATSPLHIRLNYSLTHFTLVTRQYITIGVNCLIFLLYVVVFVVFVLQRRLNRAVENSTSQKARLSLTLTYFFTHISSLCFYVPAPLFTILRTTIPSSVMSLGVKTILNRLLVHLYILNTVVNAIILGTRVRLIRQNLNAVLKPRKRKGTKSSWIINSTKD